MQSSYYARLRRRMILEKKKKKGRDSFDGASSSQDTVNRCKLKTSCLDKMFCTINFFHKVS